MTKLIKYVWLVLAIIAFIAVLCGHFHHVASFGISALMYAVCSDADKEEEESRS